MLFSWWKNRRRRRWLAQRQPAIWDAWLRANVWQYAHLEPRLQRRVTEFVCIFLKEKHWVGCRGFKLTDEMRVTIAGQAALMTLGFEQPYYFDRLKSILVYPNTFQSRPNTTDELFLGRYNEPQFGADPRLGESWRGGPIILSWKSVLQDGRHRRLRRSVVLHEFAHQMDGLDGDTDGTPPLTSFRFQERWSQVTSREYQRLVQFARRDRDTLLDQYGATNKAEFFAVATECFFTAPHEFADQHHDLYAVLCELFGQDPREWLPDQPEREAAG